MPTDVATLAYAAGLFDGEGSISIVCPKQPGYTRGVGHRLMVRLVSVDRVLPEWMNDHFGGALIDNRRQKLVGRSRPSFSWQINSYHAEIFLRAVRPYLLLKAERADVALDFRSTMLAPLGRKGVKRSVTTNPVTDEVFAKRQALRARMLELNKRGQDNPIDGDTSTVSEGTHP